MKSKIEFQYSSLPKSDNTLAKHAEIQQILVYGKAGPLRKRVMPREALRATS